MLIIGRKKHEKIIISDNIELTVLEIGRNRVRFGINAPKDVSIHTKLQELPANSAAEVAQDTHSQGPGPAREQEVPDIPAVARGAASGGRRSR